MTARLSFVRRLGAVLVLTISFAALPIHAGPTAGANGIVVVKSVYSFEDTVVRIKKDVGAKGIRFFDEINQAELAKRAGVKILPSTLLVFGNPPLGTLFIKSNPLAGLDWPVRVLVTQDEKGDVSVAYTDFAYIARRHDIKGADLESFKTASGVIASITASIAN